MGGGVQKSRSDVENMVNLVQSFSAVQHVGHSTPGHGHVLDLIISRSTENAPLNLLVQPAVFSDHTPIFIQREYQS